MEVVPVPEDLFDGEADADEDYINDATPTTLSHTRI
jgi:hypothetical protein